MNKKVIILGAGVAGMSAAHELAERGYQVIMYEAKSILGGKASSIYIPKVVPESDEKIPGEHGFRFFPGFYRHLTDTMKRIPFRDQLQGTFDNLVTTDFSRLSRIGEPDAFLPARMSAVLDIAIPFFEGRKSFQSIVRNIYSFYAEYPDDGGLNLNLNMPLSDWEYYCCRMRVFLTSCQERRLAEFEKISWWDFISATSRSKVYQKYVAQGLTRSLVAMRAELASTHTIGNSQLQLALGMIKPDWTFARVLNGPTSDVWLTPWYEHLEKQGVEIHCNSQAIALHCQQKEISGVTIQQKNQRLDVQADYYICALPIEKFLPLVTPELQEVDPSFANLHLLEIEWMNGIQFYLHKDVSMVRGHTIYYDSPWALTSISQRQFWRDETIVSLQKNKLEGVLSLCISDWNKPGILYGKSAKECSKEEIKNEVLAQIRRELDTQVAQQLNDENIVTWHIAPSVHETSEGYMFSAEPLMINVAGTYDYRPSSVTAIPNLFLASDYVQTTTDLACMEGANESARRAVNGILKASGSNALPCQLWELADFEELVYLREEDRVRFFQGLPNIFDS